MNNQENNDNIESTSSINSDDESLNDDIEELDDINLDEDLDNFTDSDTDISLKMKAYNR